MFTDDIKPVQPSQAVWWEVCSLLELLPATQLHIKGLVLGRDEVQQLAVIGTSIRELRLDAYLVRDSFWDALHLLPGLTRLTLGEGDWSLPGERRYYHTSVDAQLGRFAASSNRPLVVASPGWDEGGLRQLVPRFEQQQSAVRLRGGEVHVRPASEQVHGLPWD